MNFTVIWVVHAQDQLAEIWMAATDRNAVTAASYRLDQQLADDPLNLGESRGGIERIAFEPPLRILFRVLEPDRRVEVHEVALFGPQG